MCSDGNACNGEEVCEAGACVPAAPRIVAQVAGSPCAETKTFAAISDFDDDAVSLVDLATNQVTARVPVGDRPWGVAVDPRGARVYVTNEAANSLTVLDPLAGVAITTVPVGTFPLGVAVDPLGTRVYVANFNDGTVSILDTASDTVSGTIPVGAGPSGVAVHPAGTAVYVTNYRSNTVSVIDPTSNTVAATVPVGSQPLGVAVDPAGRRVLVTNFADGTLSVIGTASNTVVATVPAGPKPYGVAIHPAGTNAYVTSVKDDLVSVFDAATQSLVTRIAVGHNPFGVAVDPGGTRLYVPDAADNDASIVDPASNAVIGTVAVGKTPVAVGQFIGVVTTRCPQPEPDCEDSNPFTVDMCSPTTGCQHEPLAGTDAVLSGLDALDNTLHSVPFEALGSPGSIDRLEKLVADTRGLLTPVATVSPLAESARVGGPSLARKNLKRAERKLADFIRMVGHGVRRRTTRRDVGETLLDLGRATRARLRHMRAR